jgi:hypothetical protein
MSTGAAAIGNGIKLQGSWAAMCMLTSDRDVFCWGFGNTGILGDGLGISSSIPVQAQISEVTSMHASRTNDVICYSKCDGTAFCAGSDYILLLDQ